MNFVNSTSPTKSQRLIVQSTSYAPGHLKSALEKPLFSEAVKLLGSDGNTRDEGVLKMCSKNMVAFESSCNRNDPKILLLEWGTFEQSKTLDPNLQIISICQGKEIFIFETRQVGRWRELMGQCLLMHDFEKRYKTLKQLGNGNYGSVYLVEDIVNQTEFAAKNISKELAEITYEDILCEISSLQELDGNGTPQFFEFQELTDRYVIIMEFVEGQTIGRVIKELILTPQDRAQMIEAVILSLEQIHNKGMIHRDIKPSNIIMSSDLCSATIVDLGFTCEVGGIPHFNLVGTSYYMAPEVKAQKANSRLSYGPKADMYSLGIIQVEMFGSRRLEILEALEKGIPVNGLVSQTEIDFMQKLLSEDPLSRPTAEIALHHQFLNNSLDSPSINVPMAPKMKNKLTEKKNKSLNLSSLYNTFEKLDKNYFGENITTGFLRSSFEVQS